MVLLFFALQRMTGALWRSARGCRVAVHPLHVESVAWVPQRKDVLSAVFFMLTLLAYTHYTRAPSTWPVFDSGTGCCFRADVQTDAGYSAVCAFASGLLAPR